MLLTIHDAQMRKVAFVDNEKQGTLNYFQDTWTRSLETGSSAFEFTIFKKPLRLDSMEEKAYQTLNERAFVSFRYKGKDYVFNVMQVEENEYTIKCVCENLNLELINEYVNPYSAGWAMDFEAYCTAMGLLNFSQAKIHINEVADRFLKLKWEGQDTKLARLISLAHKFDAEIEFETLLNEDSSLKEFRVNVYREQSDRHQGVGRFRHDLKLVFEKNLKSVTRKIDKTNLYNAVRPIGKAKEGEQIITIGKEAPFRETNQAGQVEFFQDGQVLYAPLSKDLYPAALSHGKGTEAYIRRDLEVDSDEPAVIRAAGIRNLKKHCYPEVTYEVDGFIDAEIGDSLLIVDKGFEPILWVKARISEQKISFTEPQNNKTTFVGFQTVVNQLSDSIRTSMKRLSSQKITYNLLPHSDFDQLVATGESYTVGGQTYQVKRLPDWYSPYSGGISNPRGNYHGFFNERKFNVPVFEFNESNGSRHWKALSRGFDIGLLTAGVYTFATDVFATGSGTHVGVGLYYFNKAGQQNFHAGWSKVTVNEVNRWQRISTQLRINEDIDLSRPILIYIYGYGFTSNSILYLKRPQLVAGDRDKPYQSDSEWNRLDIGGRNLEQ